MKRLQKLCSYVLLNNRLCKNYKYANTELCYIHRISIFHNQLKFLFTMIVFLVVIFINYCIINDLDIFDIE